MKTRQLPSTVQSNIHPGYIECILSDMIDAVHAMYHLLSGYLMATLQKKVKKITQNVVFLSFRN